MEQSHVHSQNTHIQTHSYMHMFDNFKSASPRTPATPGIFCQSLWECFSVIAFNYICSWYFLPFHFCLISCTAWAVLNYWATTQYLVFSLLLTVWPLPLLMGQHSSPSLMRKWLIPSWVFCVLIIACVSVAVQVLYSGTCSDICSQPSDGAHLLLSFLGWVLE